MFNNFLTSLVYEMVQHKSADASSMDKIRIPAVFKDYLKSVSDQHLMKDLNLIVEFANGAKGLPLKGNAFFEAFLDFLTGPFAGKMDVLTGDFYALPQEKQETLIQKVIKSDSHVAESLRHLLVRYSSQELAEAIQTLSQQVAGAPFVLVQSPREMESELKKEVRANLLKKHPLSFPAFQVNRKLIGGIRIFLDGKTVDHSWHQRVLRFTSLTSA